jgi:hypothetical protein
MVLEILGHTLELWQTVLIFIFIIPYGLAFGISNVAVRFMCLFGKRLTQSDTGKFLDMLWVTTLVLVGLTLQ